MAVGDKVPLTKEELQERNLSVQCPKCKNTVTLTPAHQQINESDRSYFVGMCPNRRREHCRPIFAIYDPLNDRIIERYPIPSFDAENLSKEIPYAIRVDFAESARCKYVDANKSVVAMCRRVVEAVACDKLGQKSKDSKARTLRLIQLIDLLQTEGYITMDLRNSAHEVRFFGNYGAHPQDDGLDSVTAQEAKDIREVTDQLLYLIYVAPAMTSALKDARTAKSP